MMTPLARAIDMPPVVHKRQRSYREITNTLEIASNNLRMLTRDASANQCQEIVKQYNSALRLATKSRIHTGAIVRAML